MRHLGYISIVLLLFGLGITACTQDPIVELTRSQRLKVDTIFRDQVSLINADLEKECFEEKKTLIPRLVDSLLQVRRKEAELLRERIKSQNSKSLFDQNQ
ncbi:MAG: hypothetical protein AAFO07_00405 [Bacteroidota bacterium]